MNILVTGGTGVIGNGAIPALLRAGHGVRLLTRHASRDVRGFPEGVEAFEADLANTEELTSAAAGCEVIVHIAGIVDETPPDVTFQKVNVDGTRHLLAAAKDAEVRRFVYVSSLGAERGESDYHRSKREAEALVQSFAGEWLILRPGNVYGPGDDTISMLLKMMRTLPAVPMVDDGTQRFQPLWYSDIGKAIARSVDCEIPPERTLELAGAEVTTTAQVLDRLAEITECDPPRLAVPAWLAQVGAEAMEAFGGAGKRLFRDAGVGQPINPAKLGMLLEENVIAEGRPNALTSVFEITPTPLGDGLEMLADMLPEQLPGDGVGVVKFTSYEATIVGGPRSAAELLDYVCENITEVMPTDFSAEPDAPTSAEEGETLTLEIKGRGNVQVRLEERTGHRATFVTIEGHPLAGLMQLQATDVPGGVRFRVNTAAQPANVFDWVALRTVGETMQSVNWRTVVRRVVELSGGEAPDGVKRASQKLGDDEVRDLRAWLEKLVQRRQRRRRSAEAAGEDEPEHRRGLHAS